MTYKKYIKRNGKSYGPYVYHSRKENGKVITEYHGKFQHKKNYFLIFLVLSLLATFLIFDSFSINPASFDSLKNSILNPVISMTALASFESDDPVIKITDAEHLDSDKNFISNIFNELLELDDVWSPEISHGEYVRVAFEENLTDERDITIYPLVTEGNPKVEVYEKNQDDLLAKFTNIISDKYNKIFLTKLEGEQDTFDLKVIGGSLIFDHVIDPDVYFARSTTGEGLTDCTVNRDSSTTAGALLVATTLNNNGDTLCFDSPTQDGDIASGNWIASIDVDRGGSGGPPDPTIDVDIQIITSGGTLVETIASCTGLAISGNNLELNCSTGVGGVAQKTLSNDRIRLKITAGVGGGRLPTINYDAPLGTEGDTRTITPTLSVDNPPQWSENQTNSTAAGEAVLHSVKWTDENALSGYIFEFDNGDGVFENDTFVSFSGTTNFSNITKVANSTVGSTIRWRVYANDSTNQFNNTDIFTYTTTVDAPPTWSNPLVDDSTPNPGQTVVHNVTWDDDTALSYATLEVNGTGANCDTTANVSSTTLSGTSDVADLSWTIPQACEGKAIGWKQYANDSANQWNVTDLQTYSVNNIAPTASFGANPVDFLNSGSGSITFELKGSDNLGIDFLRLYADWSGSWTFNQTNTTPINDTFWSVTVNGIPEGQHLWGAWVNDTSVSGNEDFTDTNRTLTVDLTAPNVSINDPQNISYTTNSITFNVTATDSLTGIDFCEYSLDGAAPVSLIRDGTTDFYNDTNSSMTQGSHTVQYSCFDLVGNINNSEQVTFFIDSLAPQIDFVAPTKDNGTQANQQFVFANVSVTETNFANITFALYNASGLVNETTYTTEIFEINWTGLSNDNVKYSYNVSIFDTVGNSNKTETRELTLTADQPPTVTILFPENITYNVDVTQLNYSAADDNSVSACWFSTDGGKTNSSFDFSCSNFSGLTSIEGSNNWTVYANDSTNQLDSDVVFFTKDTVNPNIQFVATTTASGTFSQNFIDSNITASDATTGLDTITIFLYNSTGLVQSNTSSTSPFNITFSGLSDGDYFLNSTANDSAGNTNSTETRSITLDTTNPSVAYNPSTDADSDFVNRDWILVNISATDTNLDAVQMEFNGANETFANNVGNDYWSNKSGLTDGAYSFYGWANDTAGNSNLLATRTVTIDTTNPLIEYSGGTPVDNANLSQNYIFANVSVTETNFANITFTLFNSTTLVNETTYSTETFQINWTGLSDEIYNYNVTIIDKSNNQNSTATRTATIDTGAPSMNYIAPTENSGVARARNYVEVNVSASDPNLDVIVINLYNSTNDLINSSSTTSSPNFINFTNLNDGQYFYNSTANDTFGNENTLGTRNITLDTTSPNIQFIAQTTSEGSFSQNFIEANVSASDNGEGLDTITVFLYNSTGLVSSSSNNTSPNFTNFTGLSDGTYFLNATANDTLNNENQTETRTITLDTTSPTANYVAPTENSGVVKNQNFININVTASDSGTGLDAILIRLYNSTNHQINSSLTSSSPNFINFTGLNDGQYSYNVTANDTVGNSVDLTTRTITLDTTNPGINYAAPTEANNSQLNRDYIQVNVSASDTNLDTITVYLYNQTSLVQTNTSTSGQFFVNFTNLPDEKYNFNATVNDTAGNLNQTETRTVTTDTGPPSMNYVAPTESSGFLSNKDYVAVNVTASDPNFDTITIRLYDENNILLRENISSATPFFINYTALGDGLYFYNASSNDTSNNIADLETRNITLDTSGPNVRFVAPTETNDSSLTRDYIQVNVTASDNTELDTITIFLYNSTGLVDSSSNTTSPHFFNFTNLPDENYFFNATANDTSNNVNSTETREVSTDTGAPTINYVAPTENSGVIKSQDYIEVNVTAEDLNLDTITIRLYNSTNHQVNSSLTSNSPNNANFTNLADGLYFYNATANDTFGNENTLGTRNITLDNLKPSITGIVESPSDPAIYSQGQIYEFNATISDDNLDTVLIEFDGVNYTPTQNGNVYNLTLSDLSGGVYNYYWYANDTAGNANTSVQTYTIDKAASEVNLTLNGTDGNITIVQDSEIPLNLTTITGDSGATLKLYNAGNLINQGTSPLGNFSTFNEVGVFNITGFYEESENFTGSFETWYVNVTPTPDVDAPSVSSLTESPTDPATYDENNIYEFNATVTDNRNVSAVLIEFDGINYSATNLFGDVYNFTTTGLSAGVYNYRWYANDTSGNLNSTENGTYTINQATPSLNLVITPSESETFGTETTATGSNCPSQLTCTLYRDGIAVINPETATLAGGTYNYTFNTTGNANYTSATNTTNLVINKATGVVFTYLNNSRSNITVEQQTAIYLNGTLDTGTGTIELYRNGTLINQGTSPLSNLTNFTDIGSNNITTIYSGNENFTSDFETFFVEVIELDVTPPQISVLHPENTSYNSVQTELNYTASDNFGLNECWYSLDRGVTNITITCGENVSGLNSGQGISTWTVYANDVKLNENSSSVTFFVDSINPTGSYVSPTENSGSTFGRNYIQVNVSASDANLDTIEIRLYNSTGLVQTNVSSSDNFFVNFTGLTADDYSFNATINDTLGNSVDLSTRNVTLSKPDLTIVRPENETYFNNKNLLLEFTANLEDSVWYNLDGGSNTTISGNTTFNTSSGSHTLNLFANNSLGENSSSVIFAVDLSKFKVIYKKYKGNKSGSSTDFNVSSFEDVQNLSNVSLENTDNGKLEFSENINLTDDIDPGDNEVDLDSNTNISENLIDINTTALPNLNKSARLYLYNLTFSNPRVLRDGEVCPESICTEVSYSGGTFVFDVTQFTGYSAEETPSAPAPIDTGGGGASAGGGAVCTENSQCLEDEVCWNFDCVKLFDIRIIDFESPITLGDFFDFTYNIIGQANINDDIVVNFWIENQDEKVTSGSDTIYLGSFEEKTETTKLFMPSVVESGVYEFYIEVSHNGSAYTAQSHRTIEIQVEGGVVSLKPLQPERVRPFVVAFFIMLSLMVLSIIFYIERRRIIQGFAEEGRIIKKYRMTLLISVLILAIGAIFYYLNIIDIVSDLILRIAVSFREFFPVLYYGLGIISLLAVISAIVLLLKKSRILSSLSEWSKKRKLEKKFHAKYKKESKKAKKAYPEKPRKLNLSKIFSPLKKLFDSIGLLFSGIFNLFRKTGLGISKGIKPIEKETGIELKKTEKTVSKELWNLSDWINRAGEGVESGVKYAVNASKKKIPSKLTSLYGIRLHEYKFRKHGSRKKGIFKKIELFFGGLFKKTGKEFDRELGRVKVPKFKLPRIKLPKLPRFKFPKFHKPKLPKFKPLSLKTPEPPKIRFKRWKFPKLPRIKFPKFRKPKLPKFKKFKLRYPKFKSPRFKFKLPRIKLPKLPRFRGKIPKSSLDVSKSFWKINLEKEREIARKSENYLEDSARHAIRRTEEIFEDAIHLLSKVFGNKPRTQLIDDFNKHFVKTGEFTREHSKVLKEIANASKDLSKDKKQLYNQSHEIRNKAVFFINDLFGYLVNNRLISAGRERKRIEKKVRIYSKEINLAKILSRKFLRDAKFILKKSDGAIHSAYSDLKGNIDNLQERIEKEYHLREERRKLKKARRFEPKGKTFKKLADEISRDIGDFKDDMFGIKKK